MQINRRSFVRRATWAGASALVWLGRRGEVRGESESSDPRVRVRVWCEGTARPSVYPHDIDGAVAADLRRREGLSVARARLDDPAAGLSDAALDATDVLVWWGRLRHDEVPADRVAAVVERVRGARSGWSRCTARSPASRSAG